MRFFAPKEYQPRVERDYQKLEAELTRLMPYAEIEHIGSSAIRGAISKGDLDILVRVNKEDFSTAIAAIESNGFAVKPDTLRTDSLCMLVNQEAAIQLIEKGSEFEMFVRFRDLMNADPTLVASYNALKASCEGLNEQEYRARKSKFIQDVLARK